MKDLTWTNYLSLNEYIKLKHFETEYLNPTALIQWTSYGIKIKFNQLDEIILIYLKKDETSPWMVGMCYYYKSLDIKKIKSIIIKDLNELNGNSEINFLNITKEQIDNWKLNEQEVIPVPYITNYLYELAKMKTFAGNKLQKKRNHLNAFLKANHDIKVVDLKQLDVNELINFIKELGIKNNTKVPFGEIDSYMHLLKYEYNKSNNFKGIAIYINNQLVAFTLGYINGDIYEVIIEKAYKNIRGLYQYLIKTNLEFHDINCSLMDREDDIGNDYLTKSKNSYYPIIKVQRYNIFNVKKWLEK